MLGIVLEGGGLRGMYTAGVLDTLMKHGIKADSMVGVSAGALFGVNYVSGQAGRAIRYNKRFNANPDYMGIKPLLKEGNIVSTEFAYEKVPEELDPFDDEAFMASDCEFYAVITNLETGKAEYIKIESGFRQMDVLRASGSMPFVSRPVELDGNLYLDGAIADSIPYRWMMEHGADKTIVILTRDDAYRKKPMKFTKLYGRKWPNFARAMARRHALYNGQTAELKLLEKEGKAFVIRPTLPIEIGRLEKDPEKLQEVYDLGVRDAEISIKALKDYINE